jgi:putative membrane-bound dehydrogenase-like protein
LQVDQAGNVFVIESHTHFPPHDYKGPKADRILRLSDSDGDGRADKVEVFYDGLQGAMDIALSENGDMFVVTRAAVYRLRDTNKDYKADESIRLVQLETTNDYPHNALSGLALDGQGGLYFGLGENFGAAYKLKGADGIELTRQGEDGIYYCRVDGTHLRRVATGFWNPFGLCIDRVGRLFATDNDPDSRPPCRLLHIVEGGDYGYEVRYGRDGLHPFQCWNGERSGTLPMITGTGEAPCELLPYDGGLLVASWADNRLEHYVLKPKGLSFDADRKLLITGDMNFRPVGIGIGANATLFVSDWASASYELTDSGRIWRLTPKRAPSAGDGQDGTPLPAIKVLDWRVDRDAILRDLDSDDPFVRTTAIEAVARGKVEQEFLDVNLTPRQRVGLLLGQKRAGHAPSEKLVVHCLQSNVIDVQLAMLKWIADQRLAQFTELVEKGLDSPTLTPTTFVCHLSTIEMLREGNVKAVGADSTRLTDFVSDVRRTPQLRAYALRLLSPDSPNLTVELLKSMTSNADLQLRVEAIQKASVLANSECRHLLAAIAADDGQEPSLRATAIDGLGGVVEYKNQLLNWATRSQDPIRVASLRSLVGIPLNDDDETRLKGTDRTPEVARLLKSPTGMRPPSDDLDGWLQLIDQKKGDAENGRRVFFHPVLGACSRCHAAEGRGNRVGPNLSRIGQTPRRQILQSLLQPSRNVAPGFRQWVVETSNGQVRIGIPLRKGSTQEDYLGSDGQQFSLPTADIVSRQESNTSIMPDGLTAQLTDQEIANLLAYLVSQK